MRLIIHRYIFKSLLSPLFVCLLIFTFTFFVYRIFQLTDLMINKGVGPATIFQLFLFASPSFFMFTIPMSVMFAVLTSFVRMRSDNELTALKAAGVSLYRVLPPVVLLLVLSWLATLFLSTALLPKGNKALRDIFYKLASSQTDAAIKEQIFIKDFEGLTIFVRAVDQTSGELSQVFIYDDRQAENDAAIMAQRGVFLKDPQAAKVVLRLFNGVIDQLARDWSENQSITFTTYDLTINLKALASEQRKSSHRSEWSMAKLLKRMDQYKGWKRRKLSRDFHERLAIPTACLGLGLLAIPLAVGRRGAAASRSRGMLQGVVVFLAYYLLYTTLRSFSDKGFMPHWIGLWLPDLFSLCLAIVLIVRTAREKQSKTLDSLTLSPAWAGLRKIFSKKV